MSNADFLNAPFAAPVKIEGFDPTGPARFFNRELSWLAFNWRVLEEASNIAVPLLERVRFLSISATNLDEFYTVRVAGLRELQRSGVTRPAADGLTPEEQLVLIDADARALMLRQQEVWTALKADLQRADICILSREDLDDEDRDFLEERFVNQVFPILSPLAIDPAHPFPFIPNEGLSLALELMRDKDGRRLLSLLPIPRQIDRFVPLAERGDGRQRYLPLEDLLLEKIGLLFPG
ncbi:MAG: RNA degradosome polyphosphate kinase, partial [Alphaproteobacteria bacterium]|nr:RNA degradosome polyphosphate kinase [Alphaproteobacteria bacterium]